MVVLDRENLEGSPGLLAIVRWRLFQRPEGRAMDDEDRWIRGMGSGDREAWSAMYDRHVGDVFGFLHHLAGGDRALAEELNQDVWLTAVQGFDRFDPLKGKFRDWLFGIARYRVLRHDRSLANRTAVDDGTDPDGEDAGSLPPPELPEEVERARVRLRERSTSSKTSPGRPADSGTRPASAAGRP
jgi:DNA-directed RNA polymerase specialized sigma24 family protein